MVLKVVINIKTNTKILAYITSITLFMSLGFIGLIKSNQIKKELKDKDENINDALVIKEKELENSKYELLVQISKANCKQENCKEFIIIKTKTPSAKILKVKDYSNYILIYDEKVKLINIEKKEVETLELNYERNYKYDIILDNTGEIKEITYNGPKAMGYYDCITKEHIFINDFTNIIKIDEYYIKQINDEYYLLNKKGKEIFKIKEKYNWSDLVKITENGVLIHMKFINNNIVTLITYDNVGNYLSKITGEYTDITYTESEIYAYSKDRLNIYNTNGKMLKRLNLKDYKIKYIYKNNIFAIKNNNLIKINPLDNKEKIITDLNNKEVIEILYKENGQHENFKNKKGIYINLYTEVSNKITTYEILYDLETENITSYELTH